MKCIHCEREVVKAPVVSVAASAEEGAKRAVFYLSVRRGVCGHHASYDAWSYMDDATWQAIVREALDDGLTTVDRATLTVNGFAPV